MASFSGYDSVILLGDFNINLLGSDADLSKFKNFLQYSNLIQYVEQPTHFTDHSQTLIDVICSDLSVSNTVVDYIPSLSSHAFLTCELQIKKTSPPPRRFTFRPLKNMNFDRFVMDIESIDWDAMSLVSDVNEMVSQFNYAVISVFDRYAPMKSMAAKRKSYPWITYTIRKMMKLRNEAYKRFRSSGLDEHKRYYKELKRYVDSALHSEKRAYYRQHINSNANNSRALWNNLKRTIDVSNKSQDAELPMHLSDPDKINGHFCAVPGSSVASPSEVSYFESQRHDNYSFKLKTTDEETVAKVIRSLRSNALGHDGISLDMLLLTLPHSLKVITAIVNTSIVTSTFPNAWKTALITPLPKKNNVAEFNDLRPISILPCLSKVLERVVCMQISAYLEKNNILPVLQSGFRKSHSTTTALIDVVDNILTSQDVGDGTVMVLLDFSRAFDALNIPLLLAKLTYYGLEPAAVKWFASYLNDRKQIVRITNTSSTTVFSTPRPVNRGVPQGSVIGPLLFILYAADVCNKIKHCRYHLYADDIQIYLSFDPKETDTAIAKINEDLRGIALWSEANTLVLNPCKSKYMILGSRQQIDRIRNKEPFLSILGERVERVTEARNLGVRMDDGLRF